MAAGVFPLVPRRRVIGLAFGGIRSVRRGLHVAVALTLWVSAIPASPIAVVCVRA